MQNSRCGRFVGAHPKGYDIEIKERGIGLSGDNVDNQLGKKPLHDPQILLLDKPIVPWIKEQKKVVEALKDISEHKLC